MRRIRVAATRWRGRGGNATPGNRYTKASIFSPKEYGWPVRIDSHSLPTRKGAYHKVKGKVRSKFESVLQLFGPAESRRRAACEQTWSRWARLVHALLGSGGASIGNKVQILSCGNTAFKKMWDAIDQAKHSIHMETYILRLDNVGRKTIKHLHEALLRGVTVSLMYDSAGSTSVPMLIDPILHSLRANGAKIIEFNPVFPPPWRRRTHHIFHRNHRKILLVDATIAFCGGMNIADEYCGKELGGTGQFHDTHVRVEGPAAAHFAHVVRDSMREAVWEGFQNGAAAAVAAPPTSSTRYSPFAATPAVHVKNDDSTYIETIIQELKQGSKRIHDGDLAEGGGEDGVCVQVLAANSWRNMRQLQKALRLTIQYSNTRCYITSPYFLPPLSLLRAMTSAAKRGVDVRVITSGDLCDVPGAQNASRYIYSKLLTNGVRVYEYQAATLHTKAVCIDAVYSFLGSFNFDRWSYSRNLEVGVGVLNTAVSQNVEKQFLDNLRNSVEITQDDIAKASLLQRAWQFTCYMAYSFIVRM